MNKPTIYRATRGYWVCMGDVGFRCAIGIGESIANAWEDFLTERAEILGGAA